MKAKFFLIQGLAMLMLTLQLQAQWNKTNSNTTSGIHALFFEDALTGYFASGTDDWGAAHSSGYIFKTSNGGANWSQLFSADSISFKHIAVVQEAGTRKLYAFGLKNGNPVKLTTDLANQPLVWTLETISYSPTDLQVYNNTIYFVNTIDHKLERISNGQRSTVVHKAISIYDVNKYGLIYYTNNVDSLFHSPDYGNTHNLVTVNPYPNVVGQNQITYALVKKLGDTLMVKGTYPSALVYSTDNGTSWNYSYGGGEGRSIVTSDAKIHSYDHIHIHTSEDFGTTWNKGDSLELSFGSFYLYNDSMLFAFGSNGLIYKTLLSTSIKYSFPPNDIKIYPNPVNKILHIDYKQAIAIDHIELLSLSGALIRSFPTPQNSIDLSTLPKGGYLLRISDYKSVITKKVVVN